MRAQMIIRYTDGREKIVRVQDTPYRIIRNTYRANRDAPAHIAQVRWAPEWSKADFWTFVGACVLVVVLGVWMGSQL